MTPSEAEVTLVNQGFDPRFLRESRFFFLEAFKSGDLALAEAFGVCGMPLRAEGDREPAIVKAAEGGRFEAVALAMRLGARLDARDRSGDTALHTAANWNHADLVRQLVEAGATVDTVNNGGWTPLSKAVADGRTEMATVLLDLGADPKFGTVPAIWAAKTPDTLRLLLERGADPNVRVLGPSQDTMLADRVARSLPAEVELLLRHGARDEPNAVGWTGWMIARAANDPKLVQLCEAHGARPRDGWELPLHDATTVAAVDAALANGADVERVNRLGATALVVASRATRRDVVLRLLDAGADPARPDLSGRSAVTFAAAAGDLELVERLLAAGGSANESTGVDGNPRSFALGHASANGHLAVVSRLIDAGANLSSVDEHQQTAVFLAASKGKVDVLDALLNAGADPNLGGRNSSPLFIAQSNLQVACIERLARAGADLEREGLAGKTALLTACDVHNNTNPVLGRIADVLLRAGADVRHVDTIDRTPFHVAISAKNQPVIEVMERFLVCPHDLAEMHEEHLRAVVRRGDPETVRALLDAGLDAAMFSRGPCPVLFVAVSFPEVFDLALDRGADPHVCMRGIPLLRHAASSGTAAQVSRLVRAGLDPNAMSSYGDTALGQARDVETARVLVVAGAQVNPLRAGWTPLMRAAQRGSLELVEYLLSLGADPNIVASGGNSALTAAQKVRDKTVSKAIVKKLSRVTKPDLPDARGRTALFAAAMRGDVPGVVALLARGAKPDRADRDGVTPARVGALRPDVAAAMGVAYEPLVPARLAESPPVFVALRRGEGLPEPLPVDARNARGDTLLHLAVARDDRPLVARLLDAGADPNAVNEVGHTPWSVAIALHGVGLADLIQSRGGRLDIDRQLATSSHVWDFRSAVRAGDLRDVMRRVAAGEVDPHLLQKGETPVGLAASVGDDVLVGLLVDAGADLLVPTGSGSVANVAIAGGQVEIAARLLDAGAPLEPRAIQIAAEAGHTRCLRLLTERGLPLAIDVALVPDTETLRRLIDFAIDVGDRDLAARATEALGTFVA